MNAAAPRLLVSVRNAAEADATLLGGADWIDLKEPLRGALGAVDAATVREVVACVDGRVSISAAAGELVDWPDAHAGHLLDSPGVSHIKLGLAGCSAFDWRPRWRAAQSQLAAAEKQLVAVVYADANAADAPQPAEVLAAAADAGCPWVLWDTYNKSTGPLDMHLELGALCAMLATARACGQKTVVAGRLDAQAIARLPLKFIDMIAVRGAACVGSRESTVCHLRVAALRDLLVRHAECYTDSLR